MHDPSVTALRQWLLALLLVGLTGTAAELVLLRHYEDVWMLLPFAAIVVAATGVIARLLRPSARAVRWLRLSMVPLLLAGVAGAWLHYRGGLAFQADMDPTLSRWALFWKVLHMQAPPMLAPGMLGQFALLGLISTYRDPLLRTPALSKDS
jgi:hypothetical protein